LAVHRKTSVEPHGLYIAAAIVAIPTTIKMTRGTYLNVSPRVEPISGVMLMDIHARSAFEASPDLTSNVGTIVVKRYDDSISCWMEKARNSDKSLLFIINIAIHSK
jgi:hypothetical protein